MEELPDIEEEETFVPLSPKKRGRPTGSKNKTPDLYNQLMEKMTRMEEIFTSQQSSTGGTPEAPNKRVAMSKPKPHPQPISVQPAHDNLIESLQQEHKRQRQMDFYASFM